MNLDDIQIPEDTISCDYDRKLQLLKKEHDRIQREYNDLVREHYDLSWKIKQQFMKDNNEYIFQGCRHPHSRTRTSLNNYKETYCTVCKQTIWQYTTDKPLMDANQHKRNETLWHLIYKVFASFDSLDCHHEYCG